MESSFCDARFELEDAEEEVKRIATSPTDQSDPKISGYTKIIQERVASFAYAGRSSSLQFTQNRSNREKAAPTAPTKQAMKALHKRLIQAQLKVLSCDRRWRNLPVTVKRLEVLYTYHVVR